MPVYNVRCCCQPGKILGTLELSDWESDLAKSSPGLSIRLGPEPRTPDREFEIPRLELITLRPCDILGVRELAIYSDDRPIEFWRKVGRFAEATR